MEADLLYLALEKNMIVYEVRKPKSGDCYAAKAILIHSLQTRAAIHSTGKVVANTKKMMKESLDCSRKKFQALKCVVIVQQDILL